MSLNWIVPYRRAVVTEKIRYIDAFNEWISILDSGRETLSNWYGINDSYNISCHSINHWLYIFFRANQNQGVSESICLELPNTFNITEYFVRYWKGPLRVLLEEIRQGGRLSDVESNLLRNEPDGKIVKNYNAEFIIGDVIEFPFHRFLLACGMDEYRIYEFNTEGSFLLGTSLTPQPPSIGDNVQTDTSESRHLHDNLLGMKFQLLINLSLGVFYHRGYYWKDGAKKNISTRFSHNNRTLGDNKVYSRGIIYGPFFRMIEPSNRIWKIGQLRWGPAINRDDPNCYLPDERSLGHWKDDDLLTSGWACSPFTLFFSNFIIGSMNNLGNDSVDETFFKRTCHIEESRPTEGTSCINQKRRREWCRLYSEDFNNCILNSPGSDIQRFLSLAFHDTRRGNRPLYKCDVIYRIYEEILNGNIMCVINLHRPPSGHEISIVRIFPHSKLMDSEISQKGFLCAYNPIDGSNYIDDSEQTRNQGTLFIFSADAGLGGLNHRDRLAGVNLHTFNKIVWDCDNCENSALEDKTNTDCEGSFGAYSFSRISNIFILQLDNLSLERILNNLFPMVVLNRNSQWTNLEEIIGNTDTLYSERAVPFPTMTEAVGFFPTILDVKNERRRRSSAT